MRTPHPADGVIAGVWFANGLICKVLGLVPRHGEIVARVAGPEAAPALTVAIGLAEVGVAAWVLGGRRPRLCAALQIAAVAAMNAIEWALAPDLLLFGRGNAALALSFMLLVAWNGFLRRR